MSAVQSLLRFTLLALVILYSCLMLSNTAFGGYVSRSVSFPVTDSLLMAQITAKIAQDPLLAHMPIKLDINNAAVSISGQVPKQKNANDLIILVEATAGVQSVDVSGLALENGKTISSDEVINSLVIGILNREGLMGPLSQEPIIVAITGPGNATYSTPPPPIDIHVKTKDGVVYLSGSVPSQAAEDKAIGFAQSIPGVVEVQSTCKINPGP